MGVDDCLMVQTMIACHSVFVSLVNKRARRVHDTSVQKIFIGCS